MPWKSGYTVSDERSPDTVRWPQGTACAAVVVVDLAGPSGPSGISPADLCTDRVRYGYDVALPRILDMLDRHGVNATFATPAIVAELEPELVAAVATRGHEIAAHGLRHEQVSGLLRHEEAHRIERTIEALSEIAGRRPTGWYALPRATDRYPGGSISANTIDLLIAAGFSYLGNSQADDVPHHWVTDAATGRSLLALPYSTHCDDLFFVGFPQGHAGTHTERVRMLERNWTGELDAMLGMPGRPGYGRVVTMVVHPYLNGWGQRALALERVLARLGGDDAIWTPTAAACAEYWLGMYPATTTLRLEPTTWVDVPGSLS